MLGLACALLVLAPSSPSSAESSAAESSESTVNLSRPLSFSDACTCEVATVHEGMALFPTHEMNRLNKHK